jgi:hypothetical protein
MWFFLNLFLPLVVPFISSYIFNKNKDVQFGWGAFALAALTIYEGSEPGRDHKILWIEDYANPAIYSLMAIIGLTMIFAAKSKKNSAAVFPTMVALSIAAAISAFIIHWDVAS